VKLKLEKDRGQNRLMKPRESATSDREDAGSHERWSLLQARAAMIFLWAISGKRHRFVAQSNVDVNTSGHSFYGVKGGTLYDKVPELGER